MRAKLFISGALALALAAACGGDGTGPTSSGYSLAVLGGDAQFGTRNASLQEALQVVVTSSTTDKVQSGVQVQWSIVEGSGATLTTLTSTTNSNGIASTQLKLGEQLGTYRVRATTAKLVGSPAEFTARAVNAPSMTSISPTSAKAGDTLTIVGANFSTSAAENAVLFSGFRGKVVSASTSQLRVIVPLCVPTRVVSVVPMLGAVAGNNLPISVTGSSASTLQLARGEVRAFRDPNELSCFHLPGGVSGLTLLLIPQNYSEVVGSTAKFEVAGLTGSSTSAFARPAPVVLPTTDAASAWEMHLRRRERVMGLGPVASARPQYAAVAAACTSAPVVGARCDFNVINKNDKFETVTAEVKVVSTHAVIVQDVKAPANGLTTNDFTALATIFDDPIYDADVAAFGAPSDLDANGRVLILLTPVVNALTERGTSGFIAGFFYGCDLLSKTACSGSNSTEIFYALTADPTGQYSDIRSRQAVIASLPSVLAHEFQHMINFYQRGNSTDALWLSEGMAHHAEDIVAGEFERRGDAANAGVFHAQNYLRANRFLRSPQSVSLINDNDVGSLEQRGGAWLMIKYLAGQYGNQILANITKSRLSSVDNVTAQTGKTWSSLLSEWAVATWADDAPELAGVTMPKQYTYPNINIRTASTPGGQRIANSDGSLTQPFFSFADFVMQTSLPASSEVYMLVQATSATPPLLNITFAGQQGGAFASTAAPQMTILRVR